ncbi:MAG: hypothetical protein ABSD85_16345, partial [Acidimicrobiales bacterium]
MATYKITSSSSKELTTLTIAQRSPDQLFEGITTSGTFEFITLGTKSYECSKSAASSTCFSAGASTPQAELFALYEPKEYLPYFQAAVSAEGAHTSYSSMSVNGYSLSCLSVTGAPNETGTGKFCVTAQGVLGYVAWTGAKASEGGSF